MNITLSLTPAKKSIAGQKDRIAAKLNSLVGSPGFFKWEGDTLTSKSCANVEKHNKVMIFLILFVDGNYNGIDCYSKFGYGDGMEFSISNDFLNKLENTLDGINSASDINITIN